jgi:sulfatase modifying factor 1
MGRTSGSGEADELPTHDVNLSGFMIGKYEVTQMEWEDIMGSNPSFYTGDPYKPVETVNWYAVIVYCNLKSMDEGLTPVYTLNGSTNPNNWGTIPTVNDATWNGMICDWGANGYRLPSEAEWEYAARGAANNPDYTYSGSNILSDVAWYNANANGQTQIVGHLDPNGLGIHDMSGNVSEWCWDWYSSVYYNSSPNANPAGPATGSYRVARGGACDGNNVHNFTVVDRDAKAAYFNSFSYGFRVVRRLTSRK